MSTKRWLRLGPIVGVAITLAGCGGGSHATRSYPARTVASDPAPGEVVVRVGAVPITKATYEHWMAIGAVTVEMPKRRGPLPRAIAYEPPDFRACVASLRPNSTTVTTTAQLKVRCQRIYEGIQHRILNFLITGYWLRQQAKVEGIALPAATVTKKFDEERTREGSTAYRRLVAASHQTPTDFEFAIETRILSERLEKRFIASHKHLPEPMQISGFNHQIERRWVPVTECTRGFVVNDCRESKGRTAIP